MVLFIHSFAINNGRTYVKTLLKEELLEMPNYPEEDVCIVKHYDLGLKFQVQVQFSAGKQVLSIVAMIMAS